MKKILYFWAFALIMIFATQSVAYGQNIIVNGDFNNGTVLCYYGAAGIPDWTNEDPRWTPDLMNAAQQPWCSAQGFNWLGSPQNSPQGGNFACMTTAGPESISQSWNLTIGDVYTLSYWFASTPMNQTLGNSNGTDIVLSGFSGSNYNLGPTSYWAWTKKTVNLTVTGSTSKIVFKTGWTTGGDGTHGFDGVTLTKVAPPACAPALSATTQPTSKTVCSGGATTFTGSFNNATTSTTYQWLYNGNPLIADHSDANGTYTGSTTSTLNITPTGSFFNGTFSLRATNSCGAVTSNGASLTIKSAITVTATNACSSTARSLTATGPAAGVANRFFISTTNNLGLRFRPVGGSTATNGTKIELNTSSDTYAQWDVIDMGSSQFRIVNVGSGFAIDVPASDITNGTKFIIYAANTTQPNQRFTLNTATSGPIKPVLGKCMDVTNGNVASGAEIQIYDCNSTAAQTFTFTPVSDGPFTYSWTGPNGYTATGETASPAPTQDGTYTVNITGGTGSCPNSATTVVSCPLLNASPLLTGGNAVCTGATYSVTFSSNGVVTASSGTVSGNTVTGIASGVNVTLTATRSGATTTLLITAPPSCTTAPPAGCTPPSISAGNGVCNGTGTYSVAFSATAGAAISTTSGTISGNTVTGIAVGTNVTITASNGAGCTNAVTVTAPTTAQCADVCSSPAASFNSGICTGANYVVTFSKPSTTVIAVSAGATLTGGLSGSTTGTITVAQGTAVTVNATNGSCAAQEIIIKSPENGAPLLTAGNAVCTGTTYSVTFSSNGVVTASTGTVSGNTVTGIASGTNVTLTATSTNGCATTTTTVTAPPSCTTPPAGCTAPIITAGNGVCNGTGTYSVAFSATAGAVISTTSGTISGNTVTGIAVGTNVTITASNGAGCTNAVTVTAPTTAQCADVCSTPAASFSAGICTGTNYVITFSKPTTTEITVSAGATLVGGASGTTTTGTITVPQGTAVIVTAKNGTCTAQQTTFQSPNSVAPTLTAGNAVCTGTTYSVTFNSNGVVTASTGTVSGNTVTGIASGVNVTLTSTSTNGCSTTTATVSAPPSCTTAPPAGCTAPSISAGNGVCNGTGTYSVAFSATAGAIILSTSGTISGNTVTGIAVGTNVTISASNGTGCSNSVTVTAPTSAQCADVCSTPAASFSAGICTGANYVITFSKPTTTEITVSAGATLVGGASGTTTTGTITVPQGSTVTVTATKGTCAAQQTTIQAPAKVAPLLSAGNAVCTGSTYSVSFNSNGILTASTGTVSGNTVTGIASGVNVTLTASSTNGCATTTATVSAPPSCTTAPPAGCTPPSISAGNGVCNGTGTYSVAFSATTGAIILSTSGTISGNTVTGIAVGTNVTISASNGTGCSNSVTVTAPTTAQCADVCSSPAASFSAGICTGANYVVTFSKPTTTVITVSTGATLTGGLSGTTTGTITVPQGTAVTVTATNGTCAAQQTTIQAPAKVVPQLTAGNPSCTGNVYSFTYASNGIVTVSAGTISGNTVINIPSGTNVTLNSTATNGCASAQIIVNAPPSCTTPPPAGCVPPSITAGNPVCNSNGFYNVTFSATANAVITASAGTVSGTSVINIPVAGSVTITATLGTGCSNSITVSSTGDCTTACVTPAASFSLGTCTGNTYSINYNAPGTGTIVTISPSTGVTNTGSSFTGIPQGTAVTLTSQAAGCSIQHFVMQAPSIVAPLLTAGNAVCTGSTYSVTFNSNGVVTASTGTVSGNTVTGIASGVNVTLTATSTNGCATTTATVTAPPSCTTPPPAGCTPPSITAGQGLCAGSGYNVSFTASVGSTVTASAGTVSGSVVANVPLGTAVTITASNGTGCTNAVTVASPLDCTTTCATPAATFSGPVCNGSTYTVNFTKNGFSDITATSGVVNQSTGTITGIAIGTPVTIIIASTAGCATQSYTIQSPTNAAPLLTAGNAVCTGTTYSVTFSSNGLVTASTGTVSGNTVTGIASGVNVTLTSTSTNGCATTTTTVTAPPSCTTPPAGCTPPIITAGNGVCNGTGTYSVAFSATAGAVISTTSGTVSGSIVTGIAVGTNVTITASNGAGCTNAVTVTAPTTAQCANVCSTPAASFSAGICTGTNYVVTFSKPSATVITVSTGATLAGGLSGSTTGTITVPQGTAVTVTATNGTCASQQTTIQAPSKVAPLLSAGNAVCTGSTYSVSFNSNGIVTASTGTVSGNTVTGIASGTNVTLTATSTNGCATTTATVTAPPSCTTPPAGCTAPSITAGNGVCNGTTYSVAFSATAGAAISTTSGTISGNTVTGIAFGTNVTITASNGVGCTNAVTVTAPTSAQCADVCSTPAASFSAGICTGTNYVVTFSKPSATVITVSTGATLAGGLSGSTTGTITVPQGTAVTVTATNGTCAAQQTTIQAPSKVAPVLTAGNAVCSGSTYSVTFNSNGVVTASTGTVSGNTVTGIASGTNVTLTATATNGCASVTTTVNAPPSCTTPPAGCVPPTISAGQPVCSGASTYSVAFNATASATITVSAGTISGNSVINIPVSGSVTITATNGTGCSNSVLVNSTGDCTNACVTPAASYSAGTCYGSTYAVNVIKSAGTTISTSTGTVNALPAATSGTITGIAIGTAVTLTATNGTCTPQQVTIQSPTSGCVSPGGVTGAALWVRADDGAISADNTAKTTWINQSAPINLAGTGTWRINTPNQVNFNPTVTFNGTSDRMAALGLLPDAVTGTDMFSVNRSNNTGNALFSFGETSGPNRIIAHMPWSDNEVYWDFNSAGGDGRVNTTGSYFTTTTSFTPTAGLAGLDRLWSFEDLSGATSTHSLFLNGTSVVNNLSSSTLAFDGATNPAFNLGSTTAPGNWFSGNITEFITYPASITTTQRQQVESYLAVKYGQTLPYNYLATNGSVTYSVATFGNNIAGIGRDDSTVLNQKQSQSVNTANSGNIVTMGLTSIAANNLANTATFAADRNFAIWGDDLAAITYTTPYTAATGYNNRMTRVWKLTETGTINAVRLAIPTAQVPANGSIALVVSAATALTSPTVITPTGTVSINGVPNTYFDVNFTSSANSYFSFANACSTPILTAGNAVCSGTTYSVNFSSNGTVTSSVGVVSGNMVTGITSGTNVVLTSTSACGSTTTSTVTAPPSCTTPPAGCTAPSITAGNGVCNGTTYSVAFSATAGAAISTTSGTISGNTVTGIAVGTNVTITASNGVGCTNAVTVTAPTTAQCADVCSTPAASFSAGICTGTNYVVTFSKPSATVITVSTGATLVGGASGTTTGTITVLQGTAVIVNAKNGTCATQEVTIQSPSKVAPLLSAGNAVCTGSTYSVSFNSNGVVTASTGTVSGNTVTGIASGTNVTLTATSTNGCATTTATVTAPPSCTTPPAGCTAPSITAGNGVCDGTTYSVAFSATAGAAISTTSGTVSGNTVTGIAFGTNVTITASNGVGCTNAVTVTAPTSAQCADVCSTPAASFSAGICTGTNYVVTFSKPSATVITVSTGATLAGGLSGSTTGTITVPQGTAVTVTATNGTCASQQTTIQAPSKVAPVLTAGNAVCSGSTYSVTFSSNGVVTASTGTVSGNTVTGIASGTNVTLTATATNGCATTTATVTAPPSCTTPPAGCTAPSITAGNGVCDGTTYSVAFSATAGATISATSGTVSGNTVTGIAFGTNVTITASNGAGCTNAVTVTAPTSAQCADACSTSAASYSAGTCTGSTYSVTFTKASATTVTASAGTVTNGGATFTTGTITGIPLGTAVAVTATISGCTAQQTTLEAPTSVAPILTAGNAVCTGSTYSVSFNSNGVVTASTGTVSGNTVTGIASGTNVTLTARSTNGCSSTTATVTAPPSCTTPPESCTVPPSLTAGNAVCDATGFYSVAFNASNGTITTTAGTLSGSTVINIPLTATTVTITATTASGCRNAVTVSAPTGCATNPCATPAASYSAGICAGSTYSVTFTKASATTVTANAGTVTNGGATFTTGTISGIPQGTSVSVTATISGCAAQQTTIQSPTKVVPILTAGNAVCTGTTYSVTFSSNGIVTASTGTVSGNTVTGIASGTNVTLTATSTNGCASTTATVTAPPSCTTPPVDCIPPSITAGNGVCEGTTYSVAFNATTGAVISTTSGTISGNTVTGIAFGTNVTITASNGVGCTNAVTVTAPTAAQCADVCSTPAASFSAGTCNGSTYSVSFSKSSTTVVTTSAGTLIGGGSGNTVGTITGIPTGTAITVTSINGTCAAQHVIIRTPTDCLKPDLTPTLDYDSSNFVKGKITPTDFVANIFNIGKSPTNGTIVVRLSKPSSFTINYPTTNTTMGVFGGTAVTNGDWTITETTGFITFTSNNIVIPVGGRVSLGLFIAIKPTTITQTTQNMTISIVGGTGGRETPTTNNISFVQLIVN